MIKTPDKIYIFPSVAEVGRTWYKEDPGNSPYPATLYIRKDALLAFLEQRKAQQDQWIEKYHDEINQAVAFELQQIIEKINSL